LSARELHAAVGQIDLVASEGVLQIVRRHLKGRAQRAVLAHEQRAALVGLVEPLVRIQRDRVGRLDPAQQVAPALGQRREAAVCRVDV